MNCPVCDTECLENSKSCNVCKWEFTKYVTGISEGENKDGYLKLQIAKKSWKEQNTQKNKEDSIENRKTETPELDPGTFNKFEKPRSQISIPSESSGNSITFLKQVESVSLTLLFLSIFTFCLYIFVKSI